MITFLLIFFFGIANSQYVVFTNLTVKNCGQFSAVIYDISTELIAAEACFSMNDLWPTCGNLKAAQIQENCITKSKKLSSLNLLNKTEDFGNSTCDIVAPIWKFGKGSFSCAQYEYNVRTIGLSKEGCELVNNSYTNMVVGCEDGEKLNNIEEIVLWVVVGIATLGVIIGIIVILCSICRKRREYLVVN